MFTSFEGNNCFIIRKLLLEVYNLNVLFCRQGWQKSGKYSYFPGRWEIRLKGQKHRDDNIQLLPSYEVNIESYQPEGGRFPLQLLEG
jgi:hypothetical protein